jgi:hypothetical protein
VNWLLSDGQGTVQDVAQFSGGSGGGTYIADHLVFSPFGQITYQSGSGNQPRFTYLGERLDANAGLYYQGSGNSWYDAVNGVFASQGAPGYNGSIDNPFEFMGNNPFMSQLSTGYNSGDFNSGVGLMSGGGSTVPVFAGGGNEIGLANGAIILCAAPAARPQPAKGKDFRTVGPVVTRKHTVVRTETRAVHVVKIGSDGSIREKVLIQQKQLVVMVDTQRGVEKIPIPSDAIGALTEQQLAVQAQITTLEAKIADLRAKAKRARAVAVLFPEKILAWALDQAADAMNAQRLELLQQKWDLMEQIANGPWNAGDEEQWFIMRWHAPTWTDWKTVEVVPGPGWQIPGADPAIFDPELGLP